MNKVVNKLVTTIVALALLLAGVGMPLSAAVAKQSAAVDGLGDAQVAKFHKLTPYDTQGDVNAQNVYLSWTAYTGADRYKFCIYKVPATAPHDCSKSDPNWTGTFTKYYTVTNLAPGTDYGWKLMASTCWKKGCNEWKEADRATDYFFTTKSGPATQYVIISGHVPFGGLIVKYVDADSGLEYHGKSNDLGKFSFPIPYKSNGRLTAYNPASKWYSFEPLYRDYTVADTDVNLPEQGFKGYAPIIISGSVGVANATITIVGYGAFDTFCAGSISPKCTADDTLVIQSDLNGKYDVSLPWGWMGSITPTAVGYAFSPTNQAFPPIKKANLTANFTAKTSP